MSSLAAVQDFTVPGSDRRVDCGQSGDTERSDAGMRRRLLQTPPLYLSTLGIIAGDAIGNLYVFIPSWVPLAAAIISGALFLLNLRCLGMIAALFGLVSAATLPVTQLLRPDLTSQTVRRFPDGAHVAVEGWVVREPQRQGLERTYLYVDVENGAASALPMASVTGLVRVTVVGRQAFRVGDKVRVSGKIRFPRNEGDEDEFDYRAWLLRQGIAATIVAAPSKRDLMPPIMTVGHRSVFPYGLLHVIRERIARFIDLTLGYPENAEMRALIIGDRSGIDERLRQAFALTGMAHLLVISGLHLGFVASGVFLLVRLAMSAFPGLMALGCTNKVAAAAAVAAISGYAAIAGGHVSTIRALVMVLAFALGILLDRSREILASLAVAALVTCIAIPGSTADIGFQLSFASVGVILLGMRRFSAWWRWRYINPLSTQTERLPAGYAWEWVCGYFAVSFWAIVGTAPLTAFHFNQFSLVGLIANPIVVPIMGFGAVACGLAAAASSFIYPPSASWILIVAGKFAACATMLARWFLTWPLAWTRTFTPTPTEMIIAYGFILLWLTAPMAGADVLPPIRRQLAEQDSLDTGNAPSGHQKAPLHVWRRYAAVILLAAMVVDAGWWTYQRFLNYELRVTFLSVGEGDAAVVRFPGARVLLIDGGGEFRGTFDPGERIVAPYLWAHKMRLDRLCSTYGQKLAEKTI
jgi:competence protein ComEC